MADIAALTDREYLILGHHRKLSEKLAERTNENPLVEDGHDVEPDEDDYQRVYGHCHIVILLSVGNFCWFCYMLA